MQPQMENPAVATRGVPEVSLAAGKIDPEYASALKKLQVCRLVRLYAVNATMAETLAPLVFLEALR